MIHAKTALGRFVEHEIKIPVIYRVHQVPSRRVLQGLANELGGFGIDADLSDFESGLRSARIWERLQDSANPRARDLLNVLLDTFLLRSQYSAKNVGHFGLRVDAYLEPKPRDAAGLTDQLQLDAFCSGTELMSEDEISRRASHFNEQRWRRDERQYNLRFYEMLIRRLLSCGDMFLGEVARINSNDLYVRVEGFPRWGVVQHKVKDYLRTGDNLALRLDGFNLERSRFEFSVATP